MKINNLKESVLNEIKLLVSKIDFKVSKKQEDYARITFSDGKSKIDAFMWNIKKDTFSYKEGLVYNVFCYKQDFNGKAVLKVMEINEIEDQSCISEFVQNAVIPVSEIKEYIDSKIENIVDHNLRELTGELVEKYEKQYYSSAAAANNHHAYFSGMAYHVYNMLKVSELFKVHKVHYDLLVSAIILHDIGKCYELSSEAVVSYTDAGKLIGHIAIGYEIVFDYIMENARLDDQNQLLLDLILAHHGKIEYGNLKRCELVEERLINLIDTIDAYINAFIEKVEIIDEGQWSENVFALNNRKVYKNAPFLMTNETSSCELISKFVKIYNKRYENINEDLLQIAYSYYDQDFKTSYNKLLLDKEKYINNKLEFRYIKHLLLSVVCVDETQPVLGKLLEAEMLKWILEIQNFSYKGID